MSRGSVAARADMGRRLNSLTSLRFFAALFVVVHHSAREFVPWEPVLRITELGFVGVGFFFMLSGFVLTWSHQPSTSTGRFYWNRFARVYPLHALTWLLALLVLVGGGAIGDTTAGAPDAGPAVSNLLLLHDWVPSPDYYYSVNAPSWTLSCEAFFYALFPFAFGLLAGRPARQLRMVAAVISVGLLLGALAVNAVGRDGLSYYVLHQSPPYRLGGFLLGVVLALLIRAGWRPRLSLAAALVVALAPLAFFAATDGWHHWDASTVDLAAMPGTFFVIAAAASCDVDGRGGWLHSAWLIRLGQWSFALYLTHVLLLSVGEMALGDARPSLLLELAYVAAAVIVSGVFFTCFERPVEKWLRNRGAGTARPSITTEPTDPAPASGGLAGGR